MKKLPGWSIISDIVPKMMLEEKRIKEGSPSKSLNFQFFLGSFLTLLFAALFLFSGCEKEKKGVLAPKPLLVSFKLLKVKFSGEKIPERKVQNRLTGEIVDLTQSYYNSLYFTPQNFNQKAVSQLAARFFNPSALADFQKKAAFKGLIRLRPYLQKILSGKGEIKNLAVYFNKQTSEIIAVAEVKVKALYLLTDKKKVELNHQGKLVFKGEQEKLRVEEFDFQERLKTYEPEKKD